DRRNLATVIAALSADPRISRPQPNYLYWKSDDGAASAAAAVSSTAQTLAADPASFSLQYALLKLGARDAHTIARGRGTLVAVIDSGIDIDHGDLQGTVADGFDAVAEDPRFGAAETSLKDSHGTAIAGIISARGLTNGIAPGARLLNARAFSPGLAGDTAGATTMRIMRSLDWSIKRGARIVNMSFVGPRDGYVQRAIAMAMTRGAIVVAAAGNNGANARAAYPAAYKGVLAVTATDAKDALYEKANRGAYVAIAAPGVEVFVPALGDTHQIQSGTSFAAAYVSGTIALLLEREPKLSAEEVRAAIMSAADDLGAPGQDELFGAGRVNPVATLLARQQQRASGTAIAKR
ncbi:MAG: S8 family serine peptidase, partial [Pseudomonadota bacterium]